MHRGFLQSFKRSNFWTRLTHWEFWPFKVFYIPVYFYWIWLSIRARSFFFFSSSNPGIEYGGMLGESKYRIHKNLPKEYTPITMYARKGTAFDEIKRIIDKNGLSYPIILKPDIGERGWMVAKVKNDQELDAYLKSCPVDYLVQEYIDLPVELGVFYYRYPNDPKGQVTSIVKKEMLMVSGNGKDTIRELMLSDVRAKLQIANFENTSPKLLSRIPAKGEKIELEPIGNHCRGTTFLNGNSLIDKELHTVFDRLSDKIPGFYFGRFDIRCGSDEDLYTGNFKIMELNGAGAEPGHIYHPGFNIFEAYKTIISHLNALLDISRQNKHRGFPYMKFREGVEFIRRIRNYNKHKSSKLPNLS